MTPVRTRFAPSPTGFLHVGGVRTALFNYLFAKQSKGQFILRLEDTNRERFIDEGVEQIVKSLGWLGLVPDEGFWISEGQHRGIEYVQSERHKQNFYQQFADKLIKQGLAYYSYIPPEKYQELRSEKRAEPFVYKKLMEADLQESKSSGRFPIRLDTAAVKAKQVEWHDEIRGDFSDDLALIEDFILIKSDGFPTYNFANVIDDHDMKISHVIRGDEFISSTGKHALLYDLFGWERPKFVSLPLIVGADGKKLSKRSGDTDVLDYQKKGYPPVAFLNFLVLLGWNDSTAQEIFDMKDLVAKFSLERINTSPATFDSKRLDWISGQHIRQTPLDKLSEAVTEFWPTEAKGASQAYKQQVLGLVQERLKYFAELPELTRFFFVDLPVDSKLISQHKLLKKFSKEELRSLLERSRAVLEKSDFTTDDLSGKLNRLLEETKQKPVVLFSLIRIATTQAPASPGLAETLAVLGKDRSLKRVDQQMAALG